MTIVAMMPPPAPTEVVCEDCDKVIKPGARASCLNCVRKQIAAAEEDAFQEGEEEAAGENPASVIRAWAARRFVMGQISREVRAELELAADDIEVGHV